MKIDNRTESAVLHFVKRRVTPWGVCVDGLLYDDEELQKARRDHDGNLRVVVYRDPADIGSVLGAMPDGSLLKAVALRGDYAAGLTIEEHLAILVAYGKISFFRNFGARYAPLFETDACGRVDGTSGEMAAA